MDNKTPKSTDAPTCAIVVIGDEILSGRTKDTNINYIGKKCTEIGIDLMEVRIIPDDEARIIDAVNLMRSQYTYVFTTGGIGGTHDDITAESIAKAFNLKFETHPEALKIIEDYYGDRLTETRLKMAKMPMGCDLIQNPVSTVPSFFIENVYVFAGMPRVMEGMFDIVVEGLQTGAPLKSYTLTSNVLEGVLGVKLGELQSKYPNVSIGSYPFYNHPDIGTSIVLRGRDQESLKNATKDAYQLLRDLGGDIKADADIF